MYQLRDVTKTYTTGRYIIPAVHEVNLDIGDGEWLAIQGRIGHGKSTLLQLLGGLDRRTAGVVDLDGRNLTQLREADLTWVRAATSGIVSVIIFAIPSGCSFGCSYFRPGHPHSASRIRSAACWVSSAVTLA
jgi:putative ABC transport system ATP-binding protein